MNTNTYPNQRSMQRRNSILIRKKETKPQLKLPYKNVISENWQKKMEKLEKTHRQLLSTIKCLTTAEQACQEMKIKYLELKNKVLETEEKLLMEGINTSEYPAFCSEEVGTSDIEIIREPTFEELLYLEFIEEDTP